MIEVFISHSSADKDLAEAVTDLLKRSIKLLGKVRCTSSQGNKLQIGSTFVKRLRTDIEDCDVFVSIISRNSLNSQFCLFEMGAAWGLKQPIKPLLAPGTLLSDLKPPLSDLNCLTWDDEGGWLQLVREIADLTDSELRKQEVVLSTLRVFLNETKPSD